MITEARIATTDNITLSGEQTLQGVALVASNVVLVAGQTDGTTNGPYTVASGAWARHTDHDTAAEFVKPWEIFIREGTYENWRFQFTNATSSLPPTLGTTTLNFEPTQRDAVLEAGGGIEIDEVADTVGLPTQPDAVGTVYAGPLGITHTDQGVAEVVTVGDEIRGYIEGLIPKWNSGTFPTGGLPEISAGAAWVDGSVQRVIFHDDPTVVTYADIFLTPNLAYLFLSGSGMIIMSNTVDPAASPYYGTARGATSTGAGQWRYIGMLKANAAGTAFYRFRVDLLGPRLMEVSYLEDTTASPFRVVSGGAATTNQTVNLGPSGLKLVPPSCRSVYARVGVNATAGVWIDNSEMSTSPAGASGEHVITAAERTQHVWITLDSSQSFRWANVASGGSTNIDIKKYRDAR